MGDKRLDQVGPFDIERWKATRAKQVRQSTVNRELNIIRGFFSRCVDWGLLTESPVRRVKPFRVDNTRVRTLSRSEIRTLLKDAPPDIALLARITLEGLLRLSEAVYLRVDDIRDDHLVLVRTKNNRVRKVPIAAALRRDLMKRAHASGYVFGLNPAGMPVKDGMISVKFRRVAKRLGLEGVSHHTLRHTGASMMEAAGVSLRAIQEIGGWTSLRMLERYAHPRDAEKRRAVSLMADVTEEAGTKTGTESDEKRKREDKKAGKLLTANGLEWRPNGIRTRREFRSLGCFGLLDEAQPDPGRMRRVQSQA